MSALTQPQAPAFEEGRADAGKAGRTRISAGKAGIRPIEPADAEAVARLFVKTFHRNRPGPASALTRQIEKLYVDPLDKGEEIASLVHVGSDESVNGFIGVIAMPFVMRHEFRRAAFAGTLMVDSPERDPLAGAKLMRAFLAGPQDISFSETANAVSLAMWRKARGRVMSGHSLDWLRVFRPLGFALELAATRRPVARWARPLAYPLDLALGRAMPTLPRRPAGLSVRTVEESEFTRLLETLTSHHALRPFWQAMDLAEMIADARHKPKYGEMTLGAVLEGGRPIGVFAYHAHSGGIAHLLQIAAAPQAGTKVVEQLFAHAFERGLVGLRGRTQSWLIEALAGSGCLFLNRTSTLVHSRNQVFLEQALHGDAFVNGFAGEAWSPLIGRGP